MFVGWCKKQNTADDKRGEIARIESSRRWEEMESSVADSLPWFRTTGKNAEHVDPNPDGWVDVALKVCGNPPLITSIRNKVGYKIVSWELGDEEGIEGLRGKHGMITSEQEVSTWGS